MEGTSKSIQETIQQRRRKQLLDDVPLSIKKNVSGPYTRSAPAQENKVLKESDNGVVAGVGARDHPSRNIMIYGLKKNFQTEPDRYQTGVVPTRTFSGSSNPAARGEA